MSAEFQSIDDQINASYQSASQVETMSRQLEARIAKIPSAQRHMPARQYGQPVDMAKIRSNQKGGAAPLSFLLFMRAYPMDMTHNAASTSISNGLSSLAPAS